MITIVAGEEKNQKRKKFRVEQLSFLFEETEIGNILRLQSKFVSKGLLIFLQLLIWTVNQTLDKSCLKED